jgi:Domain of unknown function (DUF4190)
MRLTKQPILAIAVGLFAISALASWKNVEDAINLFQLFGQIPASYYFQLTVDILFSLVTVFGALAVVLWASIAPNASTAKWVVLVVTLLGPFASIGMSIYWMTQGSSFINAFFGNEGWKLAADIFVFVELIAAVLFAIGLLNAKKPVAETVAAQNTPAQTSPNRFDPMTGEPIAAPVAAPVGSGAQSNLPLVALILAFFVPLAAVIVGHISLNQMKQGLISSANQGMAKAGLILGYVFIGLGFLFGIIFAVVYASILSRQYY